MAQKKNEITQNGEILKEQAIPNAPETAKKTFIRSYVGDAGIFHAGKSYVLTAEQQAFFKKDIE